MSDTAMIVGSPFIYLVVLIVVLGLLKVLPK